MCHYSFLIFCTIVDNWNIQKLTEAFFPGKFFFFSNLGKKGPKLPKIRFFGLSEKFCCYFFSQNNLKWKLILLLIFHHQSHMWQNSGFWVIGQNVVGQSNYRILWNVISQERSGWLSGEVYFWHLGKQLSFLQVDTIILGVCSQTFPRYPK